MSQQLACPPAPGPLEPFAATFDPLFATLAQRRNFRAYLQGLLLPRDRKSPASATAASGAAWWLRVLGICRVWTQRSLHTWCRLLCLERLSKPWSGI